MRPSGGISIIRIGSITRSATRHSKNWIRAGTNCKEAKSMRKITSLMIILLSVFSPALAQNPVAQTLQTQQEEKQDAAPNAQPTAARLTAQDVEAFVDRVVPVQLATYD